MNKIPTQHKYFHSQNSIKCPCIYHLLFNRNFLCSVYIQIKLNSQDNSILPMSQILFKKAEKKKIVKSKTKQKTRKHPMHFLDFLDLNVVAMRSSCLSSFV